MEKITDDVIIDSVLNDGPEDAIILLISIYPDEIASAYTIYNRWKRLRSLMIRDERFANKRYEESIQEIMAISKMWDPTCFDFQLLQNLLLSSQEDKYNIQRNTRRETFKSKEVYNLFKTARPLIDSFYEFGLPADIIEASDLVVQSVNLDKQKHIKSRSNIFEVSTTDLQDYMRTAFNYLEENTVVSKSNLGHVICAIQILCGRRMIEILNSMQLHGMGPTIFSAKVSHLAKEKIQITGRSEDITIIPLLCKYTLFESVIQKIRAVEPTSGAVRTYVTTKTSKASKELFGRVLDHTVKRSIYCELCWLYKSEHNCYTTYSKKMFCGTILGHAITNFDATDQYTSITVV